MIIDLILDRKAGDRYTQDECHYLYDEAQFFGFDGIVSAFDFGSEQDVQEKLCDYCKEYMQGEALNDLCEFIKSVNWKTNL